MKNWITFGKVITSLFIAIFMLAIEYGDLLFVRDERVTITTTLVSCETKDRSTRNGIQTTIYFEIDQFPYRLRYSNPDELQGALLQKCLQKDKVSLIYQRSYSRTNGEINYLLHGMESLTDGQIILTPADIEAHINSTFYIKIFLIVIIAISVPVVIFDIYAPVLIDKIKSILT